MGFLLLTLFILLTLEWSNGLGKTPQMGWNSWNHFHCDVTEDVIRKTANAFVQLGLRDIGYQYVNIDDCWSLHDRGSDGNIIEDPQKFPSGIKKLADDLHSNQLSLGIYSDAGEKTCAGYPGSLGHELIDAQRFSSWGIDYLKYDNCNNDNIPSIKRYTDMQNALKLLSKPIFYSLCNWGSESTYSWAPEIGNSWRTTGDIQDKFSSLRTIYYTNSLHPEIAGAGGWNDPNIA